LQEEGGVSLTSTPSNAESLLDPPISGVMASKPSGTTDQKVELIPGAMHCRSKQNGTTKLDLANFVMTKSSLPSNAPAPYIHRNTGPEPLSSRSHRTPKLRKSPSTSLEPAPLDGNAEQKVDSGARLVSEEDKGYSTTLLETPMSVPQDTPIGRTVGETSSITVANGSVEASNESVLPVKQAAASAPSTSANFRAELPNAVMSCGMMQARGKPLHYRNIKTF
jgi:hypothetical protein